MFDMILVIGGAYQGKGKFAESLREQEKKAGRERTIVPQFHEWVKNCMKAEQKYRRGVAGETGTGAGSDHCM